MSSNFKQSVQQKTQSLNNARQFNAKASRHRTGHLDQQLACDERPAEGQRDQQHTHGQRSQQLTSENLYGGQRGQQLSYEKHAEGPRGQQLTCEKLADAQRGRPQLTCEKPALGASRDGHGNLAVANQLSEVSSTSSLGISQVSFDRLDVNKWIFIETTDQMYGQTNDR